MKIGKIGIIGAGKAGCTLGKFFRLNGLSVSGYFSKSQKSAEAAADFTGSVCFENDKELVNSSDAILLAVPDGEIKKVYKEIVKYGIKGKLIIHCSGSLSCEEVFSGTHDSGALYISVHPLFPISSKFESYREIGEGFFCLEGDREAVDAFELFLKSHGANVKVINGNVKPVYHAACVMVSNLMCALVQAAADELQKCGFGDDEALKALSPVIAGNARHIINSGPAAALTGPVERGDAQTVKKHLDVLSGTDLEIYRALSKKLINIAGVKNPGRDYTEIRDLLETGGK